MKNEKWLIRKIWVILVFISIFAFAIACGSGGGGDNPSPLIADSEFNNTIATSGMILDSGQYEIDHFENADPAQKQIENNDVPWIEEVRGSVLVLELTSWPPGWNVLNVVAVRMPDGVVEYKRIINRFELTDGRLAIGTVDASVLEVIDSGTIKMEGPLTKVLDRRMTNVLKQRIIAKKVAGNSVRKEVVVIDYNGSEIIDIVNFTDKDLFSYNDASMSAELSFPEITLTANPTVIINLTINKPLGLSDAVNFFADITVDITASIKKIMEELDGSVRDADGRGIVSLGVDLDQAEDVVDKILQIAVIGEKLDAIYSVLRKKERIKFAHAELSGDIEGLVAIRAYASAVYSKTGELPLAEILVPITGPVPIFLKIDLAGIYSMSFDADIEAETSLELIIPLSGSVTIVDGVFQEMTPPTFSPEVTFNSTEVEGDGAFKATAGIKVGVGISLAKILEATLNPKAEAVFESTASESASYGTGTCFDLEWDLYGEVSCQLEAELNIIVDNVEKSWDTPLNFTVYEDVAPFGSYQFGVCSNYVYICGSSSLNLCINSSACTNAGGYWWSDNTCNSTAEEIDPYYQANLFNMKQNDYYKNTYAQLVDWIGNIFNN